MLKKRSWSLQTGSSHKYQVCPICAAKAWPIYGFLIWAIVSILRIELGRIHNAHILNLAKVGQSCTAANNSSEGAAHCSATRWRTTAILDVLQSLKSSTGSKLLWGRQTVFCHISREPAERRLVNKRKTCREAASVALWFEKWNRIWNTTGTYEGLHVFIMCLSGMLDWSVVVLYSLYIFA